MATTDDRDFITLEGLAGIVETEGLGYAIEDYLSADRIADPEVRTLWDQASKAMKRIRELLPDPEEGEIAPDDGE